MKQFFKYVAATITGMVLLMFIFFLVFFSIAVSASKNKQPEISDNSVLHLKLNYYLADRTQKSPFDEIAFNLSGESRPVGLFELLRTIDKAKDDDHIKGIFMDLSSLGAGYGKLTELRNALEEFKSSGKFVYAYGELFYNQTYYLASVADKVYLNPSGTILFNGMVADVTFVKETLKKLGVEMQAVKRGKFKGAIEPFVLDELSPENRKQITEYLESIYGNFLKGISESRNIPVDSLRAIANETRVRTGRDAVGNNLIDALLYRDEIMSQMAQVMELDEDEEPKLVTAGKYSAGLKKDNKKNIGKEKIALVFADGEIVSGNGQNQEIGSHKFAKALRQAREDEHVKAVVLRVNSPGGNALASDVIWREAKLVAKEKPLIVSMGDVAASGGYFISCIADTILAMPSTITGSIGVFGLYPNAEELFDKLGLHVEVIKTGEMADFGRIDRPLSNSEMQLLDALVGDVYDRFLSRVEEGRGLDMAHLDTIAEGRVWTGEYALDLGLIDGFGGMDNAIDIAAHKAHLDDYAITAYPKTENPFEEFFNGGFSMRSVKNKILQEELGTYYGVYNKLQRLKNMSGVQAIMPYEVEFR